MALLDSFSLFTDSALTTEFNGTFTLVHQTDLSDNPQDFQLWLGSPLSDRQLQTTVNPGIDDIILDVVDTLPNWEVATAYTAGQSVQPSVGNENGFRYRCATGGTSHASVEPTWPITGVGSTVADGTVLWEFVGAKHEETEIKLALTAGGLGAATPGASLNLGDTILGGDTEAIEINIRVTNAVDIVSNNSGTPEISLSLNDVTETAAP